MDTFHCGRYIVDEARKWRSEAGALQQMEKKEFHRKRLNINAARHFLEFLFSSGLIQDIAYGTNTLVFSNGQRQCLPKSILTLSQSHTIKEYVRYCKGCNYTSLSESSLWTILKAVKPSQRYSLAGLDDITKSGIDGFTLLFDSLDKIDETNKTLRKTLETGKRYLKHGYSTHCEDESHVATHCMSHALFNEADESFQPDMCGSKHQSACKDCYSLLQSLEAMKKLSECMEESNERDEVKYDVTCGISQITDWMRHLIRAVKQNEAKKHAMASLDDKTGFWLSDWAQKILPVLHREGQKDYFGKKGMSLSVDVILTKPSDSTTVQKNVYLTAIYRCDQDMADTLCVEEHVLQQVKKDHPNINALFRKSDNAGCYAANSVAELMYRVCKKHNIKLVRYDYNEPQKGKDQADRESAICKRYLSAYVDAGNDCVSAEDVATGIMFQGGPQNSKVSVIEVDKVNTHFTESSVKNIQSYHSVKYDDNGMTFWQYFGTGTGKYVPFSNLSFESGAVVLKAFDQDHVSTSSVRKKVNSSKKRIDRQVCQLLFCPELNCTASFNTEGERMAHITTNTHTFTQHATSIDIVKENFANLVQEQSHDIFGVNGTITEIENVHDIPLYAEVFARKGWAIPKRANKRFSYAQRKFLYDKFISGENSGRKTTPEKVVIEMRTSVDENGKKIFFPNDYLTTQQVKSKFSAMSRKYRSGTLNEPEDKKTARKELAPEDEQDHDDTTEVFENVVEEAINEIIHNVTDDNLSIGQYVVAAFPEMSKKRKPAIMRHFVGQVIDFDYDEAEINFLVKKSNYYWWPANVDKSFVDIDDIHVLLQIPSMDAKEHVHFCSSDVDKIENCCKI